MTAFGYNVLRLDNQHREKLWAHASRLPNGAMLFYNHQGELAWEFKRDFPEWTVIHRVHPDHEDFFRDTPSNWYRTHANRGRDGVYIHTVNETAFSDEMLDWHTELIKIARPDTTRFVVVNSAVGIPEPDDWKHPAARRMLEEMAKDGDRHALGLHEYFPTNITAFFKGTNTPDNPSPILSLDPNTWPKDRKDAFPGWLCTRYMFVEKVCNEMGIPTPPIFLTEVGTAGIGAVDAWQKALPKTPPYTDLDGWKASREAWRQWWGHLTHEQAYAMQMLYGVKVLWAGCDVVLVFGEGDSGGWAAFDVADADTFKREMEMFLDRPTPIPVPPVDVPFPVGEFKNEYFLAPVGEFFYVREFPRVTAATVETVHGEILCMIAEHEAVIDGEYQWFPILNLEIKGWFRSDVATFVPYKENPMPDPTPNPTPAPASATVLTWLLGAGLALAIMLVLFIVLSSNTAASAQDVGAPVSLEQAAELILAAIVAIVMGAATVPVVEPLTNFVKWLTFKLGLSISADHILLGVSTVVTIAVWLAGRVGLGIQLDSLFALLVTVLPILTQLLTSLFGSKALYAAAVSAQVAGFGYQRTS